MATHKGKLRTKGAAKAKTLMQMRVWHIRGTARRGRVCREQRKQVRSLGGEVEGLARITWVLQALRLTQSEMGRHGRVGREK